MDRRDLDDIARGIIVVMQNLELRMQNVERGLERVKNFSWEKCAKETMDVLLGEGS